MQKTFVVVSVRGIACLVMKIRNEQDQNLLERILVTGATCYERNVVPVRFNYEATRALSATGFNSAS